MRNFRIRRSDPAAGARACGRPGEDKQPGISPRLRRPEATNRATSTGALLGLIVFAGCGPSAADFELYDTFRSPQNSREVVVQIAYSKLAFGPTTVRFSARDVDSAELVEIVTTRISNDGSNITDENLGAEWVNERTLRLCLRGVEQADSVLEIDVVSGTHSETESPCGTT